jgi:hypothetical protein
MMAEIASSLHRFAADVGKKPDGTRQGTRLLPSCYWPYATNARGLGSVPGGQEVCRNRMDQNYFRDIAGPINSRLPGLRVNFVPDFVNFCREKTRLIQLITLIQA